MKKALGAVGALLLAFVVVAGITATPLVGEVVTLHTRDVDGAWKTTPLWIVDASDGTYLRAGDPESGWAVRLRADPKARLERQGAVADVTLVPAPERREEVHGLMAAKYGWADDFVGLMADRGAALPLRVEPVAPGP